MEPVSLGQLFRYLSGDIGFILALSLALVAATAVLENVLAFRLWVHFRGIGPVRNELLKDVKVDWGRREIPLLVVRWLARIGLFAALALLLLAAGRAALEIYRLGGVPTRYGAWRLPLAEDLVGVQAALWVLLVVLGIRMVFGGLAGIFQRKAAWYVRAGEALPDANQIARIEALSDSLDEDIEDSSP